MFRRANIRDSRVYYPLKAIPYKGAYAILDDRRMVIAEGMSKVVAEELVGTVETCAHALAHLQKAITLHQTPVVAHSAVRKFFEDVFHFLKSIGVLPLPRKDVIDLSHIRSMDELF